MNTLKSLTIFYEKLSTFGKILLFMKNIYYIFYPILSESDELIGFNESIDLHLVV